MDQWLNVIGGEVHAPGNITCKAADGGGRTIDFLIVDRRIAHGIRGVWTILDVASSPHFAVLLRIEVVASRVFIQKIISP